MDGDELASAPFQGSNWEVFQDSFAPQPTRQNLKAWDRAPVPAHAPRLQGQKIWKKINTRSQSNRENKENQEDAQIELEREGKGARKRMRAINNKENISNAPWLPNGKEIETVFGGKESPKKKARFSLAVGDDDALLVPRKRTNTNHLITPRKPLRNLPINSVTKAENGVPGSAEKVGQTGTQDGVVAAEGNGIAEPGTPTEKPARRRKSMRKSLRRLTSGDISQESPAAMGEKLEGAAITFGNASPTKTSPMKRAARARDSLEVGAGLPIQGDSDVEATIIVNISAVSPGAQESMVNDFEVQEMVVEEAASGRRKSLRKSTRRVTFGATKEVIEFGPILTPPPKPKTNAEEVDEDAEIRAINKQLEQELRASRSVEPSPESPVKSSLVEAVAASIVEMRGFGDIPVTISPEKKAERKETLQAECDSDGAVVLAREKSRGEVTNGVLEPEYESTFGDANQLEDFISASMSPTPLAGSAQPSRNMTPVPWNANPGLGSPTKVSHTPRRTRKTPQRGVKRLSPRSRQSSPKKIVLFASPRKLAAGEDTPKANQATALSEAREPEVHFAQLENASPLPSPKELSNFSPREMTDKERNSTMGTSTSSEMSPTAKNIAVPVMDTNTPRRLFPTLDSFWSGISGRGSASKSSLLSNPAQTTLHATAPNNVEVNDRATEDSADELPEHSYSTDNDPVSEPVDIFHSQESVASSDGLGFETSNLSSNVDQGGGWVVGSPRKMIHFEENTEDQSGTSMAEDSESEDHEALEPISLSLTHIDEDITPENSINDDATETINMDSLPALPEEAANSTSMTTNYDHDDDTDMLRNFLSRVKANKAAKGASSIPKRKRSLPHSPIRLPLGTMDANSSPTSSPKTKEEEPELSIVVESPPKRRKRNNHSAEEDLTEPRSVRRSGRTRLPVKSAIPAPSFIPVRRLGQDGDATVTLRRNEDKELAAVTRVNTRKNKGTALFPLEYLKKQAEEKHDPAARHKALQEVFDEKTHKKKSSKKRKTVVWAEELAQYQSLEEKSSEEEVKPPVKEKTKEKRKAPVEEKKTRIKTPVKVGVRSNMTLGMAGNGTPAPVSKRKTRGHA